MTNIFLRYTLKKITRQKSDALSGCKIPSKIDKVTHIIKVKSWDTPVHYTMIARARMKFYFCRIN